MDTNIIIHFSPPKVVVNSFTGGFVIPSITTSDMTGVMAAINANHELQGAWQQAQ